MGAVKQAGGHIKVISEPGAGTTFQVYLPAVDVESLTLAEGELARPAIPTGTETVLVVEDEDSVRTFAHLVPRMPATDMVMPRLDGRELAQVLKQHKPAIRILFLSGYGDQDQAQAEAEGAFLQKPFSVAALASQVRAVLDAKGS